MKKFIPASIIMMCLFVCMTADAQSIKEMWAAKKLEAKEKMRKKLEDKSSQGIDTVMNKPEQIVKMKMKKKGNKSKIKSETTDETQENVVLPSPTQEPSTSSSMEGQGAQTVIQTNIFCDAGKTKIENILKKQDGVFDVKANIKNGEVAIRYNSDGTSYSELLKLITQQGFDAEGTKPAAGAPVNPCKK